MNYLLTQALADRAQVSATTVREYCRQGLLHPIKDSSGRRLFTEADAVLVRGIFLANIARRPMATRAEGGEGDVSKTTCDPSLAAEDHQDG